MTDYNDGKWHGWNGGKCPVHPKSNVCGIYMDNEVVPHQKPVFDCASEFDWDRSGSYILIAFRVVEAYVEPKEYTIDPRKNIMWYSHEDGLVHVKELTE